MLKRLAVAALVLPFLAACGATPNPGDSVERDQLHQRVLASINDFRGVDPSIDRFIKSAHAYAVFPRILTAAVGVGGAHGNGEVFENGKLVGYSDVSQGNIGVQLGAQRYAEIIFFENEGAFIDFKYATTEFDARATAIAASRGAAATADYRRGVIIFTLPETGLMAQAAIGGQKFRFEPIVTSRR